MRSTPSWLAELQEMTPTLKRFALALSRNTAEADDLVQQTLMKAWFRPDSFRPGSNLRAWLFTILKNEHYTVTRRRRREVPDANGYYAAALSVPPSQEFAVDLRLLQSAIDKLPDVQRRALLLISAGEFSFSEAATLSGCPLSTMKGRVSRARTMLSLELSRAD
jgi:RNA polymerase sigma-70 factor (ECF subfamily)